MFDKVLALVAPHECISCSREGKLLCAGCIAGLPQAASRCYRCHKASQDWRTCSSCRRDSKLFALAASFKYDGAAEALVRKLKYSHAQSAAGVIAEQLAISIPGAPSLIISYLPTATSRVRSRGFDQALLIAKNLSASTGLPLVSFLARLGQERQVGASRLGRQAQAALAYRVCNPSLLVGANILLVDDVVTTGASLESAAAVLRASGAHRIYGLVFCQA